MEETGELAELVERVAALDIGKAALTACIRVPHEDKPGRRCQEVREYATTTRSLLALADRLRCQGVTLVVMEATSSYWKPPYYLLEAEGFECWLLNARHVKNVPGRPKTDKCAWPGGHPGGMKCSPRGSPGAVAVSRVEPLGVRDKFGAGPAGPGIVATSTNPSFGYCQVLPGGSSPQPSEEERWN